MKKKEKLGRLPLTISRYLIQFQSYECLKKFREEKSVTS